MNGRPGIHGRHTSVFIAEILLLFLSTVNFVRSLADKAIANGALVIATGRPTTVRHCYKQSQCVYIDVWSH